MFTWADRRRDEGGFTLVEVVVAVVIFGLAAAALVPVMIAGTKAARLAQLNTVAKNLAQERTDLMRNLPYHVDRQNGPFIDLLDQYYRNLSTTPTVLPSGGTGTWVASGSGAGGTPTGPYYEVDFPAGYRPSYPSFSQSVYTQFLQPNKLPVTPLPSTAFTGYDSQAVGHDQPPSLIVGVTVITSWTSYGTAHHFSVYTQITDAGGAGVQISSDAHAVALQVISGAPGGAGVLTAQVGVVDAAGRLSTGSNATVNAEGAYVVANDGSRIDGYQASAISPPNPAGTSGTFLSSSTRVIGTSGSCGWASFGPTSVSDITSTTAGGLPLAPTDVSSGQSLAANLNANGSTGSCAGFQFSNEIDGAPPTDPGMNLPLGPMVLVKDASGNGPIVTGNASVSATSSAGVAGSITGTAGASFARLVQVFPGVIASAYTDDTSGDCIYNSSPVRCGNGVVNVFLSTATLSCSSGSATATAHVRGYLTYLDMTDVSHPWQTVDLDWDSTQSVSDPLAAINLGLVQVPTSAGNVPLSTYVTSLSAARGVTGGIVGGMQTIEAAIAVGTAPTRGTSDPASSIGVEVGHLACAAADNR